MKNENKLLLPLWIIVVFLLFTVLYIGKSIFVTLIFTTILLFIFSGMYSFFEKYFRLQSVAMILTGGVFILFFGIVGYIITSQIDTFTQDISKIGTGFTQLTQNYDVIGQYIQDFDIVAMLEKIDFATLGKSALGLMSGIIGGLGTVGFLLVFLMLEKNAFQSKFQKILPKKSEKKFFAIYQRIFNDMNTFFLSKFSLALFNGIVSYIVMLIFGLEYALVFALFVFLLDFIPAIGGLIALALPFLYSFVQFDSSLMSAVLLLCLFIPQFISGNLIEPKIMGNRLNLSGFVILVSLIFWSSMWGLVGAFLAVPLMASINIVLSKFEITQPIAIILSKNGKI